MTPQARSDLKNILKYTQKTWGSEQRERYKKLLNDAFTKIAANPARGFPREELRPGYYSYHVGSHGRHYIFYRVLDDTVEVVRILHDSMDIRQHFPEQATQQEEEN
ncbi:MAG TPA: plasmid stabilization protein ParE [Cyanobacteria bacterium UBA12227]|nr:plasmid stabilization protein ParE [Cyanobacteria bacterium UBA12227]